MRMTNEQFQAEVFRRSRVYQQQRQVRRRRTFAGALAFCGCFALVFTAARLNLTEKNSEMNMTADVAQKADQSKSNDYAYEAAEESSEADAPAAENFDGSLNIRGETQDVHENNAASDSCEEESCEDSCEDSAAGDSYKDAADEPYFEEMTDTELFAYFGIAPLPDTLAGLSYDGCNVDFSIGDDKKSGIAYLNPDKDQVLDDRNLFWYRSADGKQVLTVHIEYKHAKEMPAATSQNDTAPKIVYGQQDKTTESAFLLQTGDLFVAIFATNMTHEQLEEAAETLCALIVH